MSQNHIGTAPYFCLQLDIRKSPLYPLNSVTDERTPWTPCFLLFEYKKFIFVITFASFSLYPLHHFHYTLCIIFIIPFASFSLQPLHHFRYSFCVIFVIPIVSYWLSVKEYITTWTIIQAGWVSALSSPPISQWDNSNALSYQIDCLHDDLP